MSLAMPKPSTLEAYFALEHASDIKHEFLNGEILAMGGGSSAHNSLVAEIHGGLHAQLRGRGCRTFIGDQRLKLNTRSYVYPDVMVVCEQPAFVLDTGLESLLNPVLVVEVLSPSTELYDRSEKFLRYLALESLQEYVLVAQNRPRVEVFTRQADNRWLLTVSEGLDSTTVLESIDCTLSLAEIYQWVTFSDDDATDDQ
ncbi:MAG: Uma2 family endonuclease [Chloroflexi bacterium]|nr:Uma2 family endonuclease [Chloroflexota bacterium]